MRCFIGLPLADELRDAMSDAWAEAEKPTNLKRVNEGQWHMTLAFLGDIDPAHVRDLVKVCEQHTDRPGTITLNAFETFPTERPRLIVARGVPEPLHAWKMFVNHLRKQCGMYAPRMDQKPWTAHITLARAEKHVTLSEWSVPVGPWTWKPGGFILYESKLTPNGAVYREIHEYPFNR